MSPLGRPVLLDAIKKKNGILSSIVTHMKII